MKLNELEIIILREIVHHQIRNHNLNLERQLKSLEVKSRDFTGFGIYVHFELESQADLTLNLEGRKKYISSPTEIYLDTLKHHISYELNLNDKGQFDFLEIVPNGVDKWNGKYEKIKLQPTRGA